MKKFLSLLTSGWFIALVGLLLLSLLIWLGGIALVLGVQVRWVGLAMALFTVVVGSIFHAYWAVPADQAAVMQLLFMKNISVAGGLLLISALGAGPLSVGGRRKALQ